MYYDNGGEKIEHNPFLQLLGTQTEKYESNKEKYCKTGATSMADAGYII